LFVLFAFVIENAAKSDELKTEFNIRSFLNNSTLLTVISGSGATTGLAVVDIQLFAVRAISSRVNVYNSNDFTPTHNISITGASYLIAMVASPRHNCIYVSDRVYGPNVIYKYSLSDNVITKWYGGGDIYGLSVTNTSNVLVTVYNTKEIKEYTPNGSLVRVISLNDSIEGPWHSVQLSSDRFVVSHGINDQLHRVCIVDTNGSIITCYGSKGGSNVRQLGSPRGLTVDGHGNVLVADHDNNRVVLLSPSLTHLGYVNIPGHRLQVPYALHLDERNRRLYIGEDLTAGHVVVLTVN